ncbi:MAG: gamma-glutamylcyclotransferase [Pseudomonadota bacterium]
MAFRVDSGAEAETLSYLRERELISSAYHEAVRQIRLADGRTLSALAYIVDTEHRQYCGHLPLEDQARIIAHARGGRGPNSEYLHQTVTHLRTLGIADAELDWLDQRVEALK